MTSPSHENISKHKTVYQKTNQQTNQQTNKPKHSPFLHWQPMHHREVADNGLHPTAPS
jgi:hypothetical protein